MSAIGERMAVVSLGLSCQTSRQIDGHVPLLRKLTGDETIDKASLPFDWLISTPHGLESLIGSGTFFPEDPAALYDDHGRLRSREHELLYWHVSRHASRVGHPSFDDARSKFAHTSGRFGAISKLDRVIAVVSDTQGNLPWVQDEWKVPLLDTTPAQAEQLRRTFADFLGRPVDLLMVSRNARPDFEQRADFAYYHMVPEPEGWAGSGRDWAAVFQDYFSRG